MERHCDRLRPICRLERWPDYLEDGLILASSAVFQGGPAFPWLAAERLSLSFKEDKLDAP